MSVFKKVLPAVLTLGLIVALPQTVQAGHYHHKHTTGHGVGLHGKGLSLSFGGHGGKYLSEKQYQLYKKHKHHNKYRSYGLAQYKHKLHKKQRFALKWHRARNHLDVGSIRHRGTRLARR